MRKAILLVLLSFFGYFLNSVYRPYAYANRINDFGIADIGNNLIFLPASWLVFGFLMPKKVKIYEDSRSWIIVNFFILAFVEILSSKFPVFGTFDFKDIIGLFIGMFIALYINKYLEHKETIF